MPQQKLVNVKNIPSAVHPRGDRWMVLAAYPPITEDYPTKEAAEAAAVAAGFEVTDTPLCVNCGKELVPGAPRHFVVPRRSSYGFRFTCKRE